MASVCAICQSDGQERVFEDSEEYNAHIRSQHNPVPLAAPVPTDGEREYTDAERYQLIGEALESVQQRVVNLANRIEQLEANRVTDLQRIEALETALAALQPPAPPVT